MAYKKYSVLKKLPSNRFTVVVAVVIVLSLNHSLCSGGNGDDIDEVDVDLENDAEPEHFVPTKEWQKVEDNVVLPSGLHVRMNLETGEKEAKLVDPSNQMEDDLIEEDLETERFSDKRRLNHFGYSDRSGIVNKKTAVFTKERLKRMLQNSNTDLDQPTTDTPKLLSHVHTRHSNVDRREDSTRDEKMTQFENKFLTKEQEIMVGCFNALSNPNSSEEDIMANLEELEYFVHSFDNGEFFGATGGLALVLNFVNHTKSNIRSFAAQVVGSSTQSNPNVKQQAVQLGALEALVPNLSYCRPDIEQRRALYAISSLLRRSMEAQEKFITQLHGFEAIIDHAEEKSVKFHLKAVVILTDIINELFEDHTDDQHRTLGLQLLNAVSDSNWCQVIARLLYGGEIDHQQKALEGMVTCSKVCDFTGHVPRLQELRDIWERSGDTDHLTLVNRMISQFTDNYSHEEL